MQIGSEYDCVPTLCIQTPLHFSALKHIANMQHKVPFLKHIPNGQHKVSYLLLGTIAYMLLNR